MWGRARSDQGGLLTEALTDDGALTLDRGHVVLGDGTGMRWRRPWHDVDRGFWDAETHTLTITWVDGGSDALTTVEPYPREMPTLLRELVQASIVHVESAPIPGGGSVRVAIRRTDEGELISQVLAVGTVRSQEQLEAVSRDVERRARESVGL